MPELKEQQKQAIQHDKGNILVSASAGSGKTFVMIERLIRLIIEKKADVKQMLAVTFTEAAAADMKEKLKVALVKKINKGNVELSDQLTNVCAADISTLHSFCSRLLRQYFFAAGIAPDFIIADEDRAGELRADCMDRLFRNLYERADEQFRTVCARYKDKRKDDSLKKLVLSLYNYARSEEDPYGFLDKYNLTFSKQGFIKMRNEYSQRFTDGVSRLISRAKSLCDECVAVGFDKGESFAENLLEAMERLLSDGMYAAKKSDEYKVRADFGRKLDAGKLELKEKLVCVKDEFVALTSRFSKYLTTPESDAAMTDGLYKHTAALVRLVKLFDEEYAKAKREENLLDFSDLEHLTLKALKDPQVVTAVREKYKYVFADEYQDINGVQESILSLVSNDNMFMVGDVKQSIYGFRGCRPEIFADKEQAMFKRGESTVRLNHNFRSAPAVIDMVNKIFDYSMTNEWAGLDYKGTARLISGGLYGEKAAGRSEIHLLKKQSAKRETETPRVYDVLDEIKKVKNGNSLAIASLITEIINGELQKNYYDTKSNSFKKVEFSDIAILTRVRESDYVARLVSGLIAHGVPVVSEVKENACDFPEIAALINALKLIDCFYQDIPLISTLLCPLGGFTEEELAETALYYQDNYVAPKGSARGGFTQAFLYYVHNADTPLAVRFKAFVEYVERIRFVADFTGAAGALERLVADSGYENYLLASPGGEVKAKRLHAFLAAAIDGDKRFTVKEFLRRAEMSEGAFAVAQESEENAVRVMTIHASKGLEFPVVIVCGLEKKINAREDFEQVLTDRTAGIATRYYDDDTRTVSQTLTRGVFVEHNRENRIKEELRLFYVALTRAAYSLHLTFECKDDPRRHEFIGAEKFLDYVPADLPVTEWSEEDFQFTDKSRERRHILLSNKDDEAVSRMRENFGYVYPFAADTTLPLKGSVTGVLEETAEREYVSRVLYEEGQTDKERGTIAHKIMQNFDFLRGNVAEQTDEMIADGILTAQEAGKIDLTRLQRAVDGGAFAGIGEYVLFRERQFIADSPAKRVFGVDSNESVLLQGVIDLLCVKDGQAMVIDYKYSVLTAQSLAEKYSKQLELYALAAERALGVKITSKRLVNLYTGEWTEC